MRGRIWNGTHTFRVELVLVGLRFGSVSLSILGAGVAAAVAVGLSVPGTVGGIAAACIAAVTLAATMRMAFWLHEVDRNHTLSEALIVSSLISGARHRTWTNLDVMVED